MLSTSIKLNIRWGTVKSDMFNELGTLSGNGPNRLYRLVWLIKLVLLFLIIIKQKIKR